MVVGGVAVDGYLDNSLVFLDVNANKTYDEGTDYLGSIDSAGNFEIPVSSSEVSGQIVIAGGTDTFSGQDIYTEMLAPVGYDIVSPLTTLLACDSSLSPAMIIKVFGLDPTIHLASDDAIAMMKNGSEAGEALFTVQQTIFTILQATASMGLAQHANPGLELKGLYVQEAASAMANAIRELELGLGGNQLDLQDRLTIITSKAVKSMLLVIDSDMDLSLLTIKAQQITNAIVTVNNAIINNYSSLAQNLSQVDSSIAADAAVAVSQAAAGVSQNSLITAIQTIVQASTSADVNAIGSAYTSSVLSSIENNAQIFIADFPSGSAVSGTLSVAAFHALIAKDSDIQFGDLIITDPHITLTELQEIQARVSGTIDLINSNLLATSADIEALANNPIAVSQLVANQITDITINESLDLTSGWLPIDQIDLIQNASLNQIKTHLNLNGGEISALAFDAALNNILPKNIQSIDPAQELTYEQTIQTLLESGITDFTVESGMFKISDGLMASLVDAGMLHALPIANLIIDASQQNTNTNAQAGMHLLTDLQAMSKLDVDGIKVADSINKVYLDIGKMTNAGSEEQIALEIRQILASLAQTNDGDSNSAFAKNTNGESVDIALIMSGDIASALINQGGLNSADLANLNYLGINEIDIVSDNVEINNSQLVSDKVAQDSTYLPEVKLIGSTTNSAVQELDDQLLFKI